MGRTYVCIDLKSYYASVELADRKGCCHQANNADHWL